MRKQFTLAFILSCITLLTEAQIRLNVKVFLQGAYSSSLSRHKNVTDKWGYVLNTYALNQPYNVSPWNYSGTESVGEYYFAPSGETDEDPIDWVVVELRDSACPNTVVERQALFLVENGKILNLDGYSLPWFSSPPGHYYVAIRHRNHLGIVSAVPVTLSTYSPSLYDFSTAQSQAYQYTPHTYDAMASLGAGVYGMWGGNANRVAPVRASGAGSVNDYLYLKDTILGGSTATIIDSVYNTADLNMDGTVRASGPASINDYLFLMSPGVLNGDVNKIIDEHDTYDLDCEEGFASLAILTRGGLPLSSLRVWPNPVVNEVRISSELSIDAITVVDLYGRIVKQAKGSGATTSIINVKDLTSGVYYFLVTSGKKINTAKVVVQR